MNWRKTAIEDLQKYNGLKFSLTSINNKIEALDYKKNGLKSFQSDKEPISGGAMKREDFVLDSIIEQERLKSLLEVNTRLLGLIDGGLKSLNDRERLILEKFYISRPRDYIDELTNVLNFEKTQIYRLKDKALEKFTLNMYGIMEY